MNVTSFFERFAQPFKTAGFITTALAMPAILAGCSSSNTAPFRATPNVPVGPTTIAVTVIPAPPNNELTAIGQSATFTFTLDDATPTELTIPFTTTLATTPAGSDSATFADPGLPPNGTVTIPAGADSATLVTPTVATLPGLDATTRITLNVPATTLGGAEAFFSVRGPQTPALVSQLPLAAAVPPNTDVLGTGIFVQGNPAGLTTVTTIPASAQPFVLREDIVLQGFLVFAPADVTFASFPNVTDLSFVGSVPPDTCAYIAPIASTDPSADFIAKTATCP